MRHHTHHPTFTSHYRHDPTAGPGKEAALRWLARQLQWEHVLAELRTPGPADDEAGPVRR